MNEAIVGLEIGLDRFSRDCSLRQQKNLQGWRVDASRLVAHMEPHPLSRTTLAREGQVGLGVDPNLDAMLHPITFMKYRQ